MWLHGLVAAFIGGGAGAVSAGFSAAVLAPDQFNLSTGILPMLKLMVLTFTVSGIVAGMALTDAAMTMELSASHEPLQQALRAKHRRQGHNCASLPRPDL
jgi:hypothetical protein